MGSIINIFGNIDSNPILFIVMLLTIAIYFNLLLLLSFGTYYMVHFSNKYVDQNRRIRLGKKHIFFILLTVALIVIFVTIYHFRDLIWWLLRPVLWAIIFSYLLNPAVHILGKRGISRLWSVIMIFTFIATIVSVLFITITPILINEIKNLVELLPKYTIEASEFITRMYEKVEQLDNLSPQMSAIRDPIDEYLVNIQNKIIATINEMTRRIFDTLSNVITIILIPIYSFYFLKDGIHFKKKFTLMIPKLFRQEFLEIAKDIDKLLSKFIRGQLVVASCVGILCMIALFIIRVDFAILIGMIAGISNIIPYIGPIIGAIPGVIIALLDEPSKAIWVLIAFIIIQQFESAVLSPKIVGESVGLNPIIIIITLFLGNELYGVAGMIFGVPMVASIKIIFKHIAAYVIEGE
ncbi:MAG: AI-2E family transporter [Alkaliphilus sp.]|nr:AI-2E family transporter [Alkaliphilus sp.]